MSRREQREVPRVQPFVAPCRVLLGTRRVRGYLTDLSTKGAQVVVETHAPGAGDRVTLEVRLGGRAPKVRLDAEVKWARRLSGDAGHAFGLTFADVSGEQLETLEDALADVRRRAADLV